MNLSLRVRSAALLTATCLLVAVPVHADPPPPAARPVYRFDFAVTGVEDGPRANPATYTLVLQENQTGHVSTGTNIPLGPAANGAVAARMDVGLNLHFSFAQRGTALLLSGGFELSTADATGAGPVSVHRVRSESVVAVSPGTPALVTSVYDLTSHRRYEVTVSAQRVM